MSKQITPEPSNGGELDESALTEVVGGASAHLIRPLQTRINVVQTPSFDQVRSLLDGFNVPTIQPLPAGGVFAEDTNGAGIGKVGKDGVGGVVRVGF